MEIDGKVIMGPFTVHDRGALIHIEGQPLPWPGPRRAQVAKIDATIVATVRSEDGAYQHYPRSVALAHADLLARAPDMALEIERLRYDRAILFAALDDLLDCCELNLDDLEPETRERITEAQTAMKKAKQK